MAEDPSSFISKRKEQMKKKASFDWNDVVKLIAVLKDGHRITMGKKSVKGIVRALYIAAIHRY